MPRAASYSLIEYLSVEFFRFLVIAYGGSNCNVGKDHSGLHCWRPFYPLDKSFRSVITAIATRPKQGLRSPTASDTGRDRTGRRGLCHQLLFFFRWLAVLAWVRPVGTDLVNRSVGVDRRSNTALGLAVSRRLGRSAVPVTEGRDTFRVRSVCCRRFCYWYPASGFDVWQAALSVPVVCRAIHTALIFAPRCLTCVAVDPMDR